MGKVSNFPLKKSLSIGMDDAVISSCIWHPQGWYSEWKLPRFQVLTIEYEKRQQGIIILLTFKKGLFYWLVGDAILGTGERDLSGKGGWWNGWSDVSMGVYSSQYDMANERIWFKSLELHWALASVSFWRQAPKVRTAPHVCLCKLSFLRQSCLQAELCAHLYKLSCAAAVRLLFCFENRHPHSL